jgi:hypothetical protein
MRQGILLLQGNLTYLPNLGLTRNRLRIDMLSVYIVADNPIWEFNLGLLKRHQILELKEIIR